MGKKWLLSSLCFIAIFMGGCAYAQELPQNTPVRWSYAISMEELQKEYIRLVNKDNLLPSNYMPENLTKVKVKKASSSAIQMCQIASDALDEMFAAASAQGITLYAKSGYRSYQTQNTMYRNRLEKDGGKDEGVIAFPGASDHQTGLGIDVTSKAWTDKKLNGDFGNTDEAQWMAAHCAEYGFVIRYPKEKEDITQIIYEPWHLRYVGKDAAAYMMEKGLTLEEFTVEWQQALADYEATGGSVGQAMVQSQDVPGTVIETGTGSDDDPEVSWFH